MERRRAAISAAHVVGYGRRGWENEAGMLAALKALHMELSGPKVADHRGRIVKVTDHEALVEHAGGVGAGQCAVSLQRSMSEREPD